MLTVLGHLLSQLFLDLFGRGHILQPLVPHVGLLHRRGDLCWLHIRNEEVAKLLLLVLLSSFSLFRLLLLPSQFFLPLPLKLLALLALPLLLLLLQLLLNS